jgi:hypothetical protein
MGFFLLFTGILIGFKGIYWNVMIEKKLGFFKNDTIIFQGKNIKKELQIGKLIISILNGCFIMILLESNLIIFYQIHFLSKKIITKTFKKFIKKILLKKFY